MHRIVVHDTMSDGRENVLEIGERIDLERVSFLRKRRFHLADDSGQGRLSDETVTGSLLQHIDDSCCGIPGRHRERLHTMG